MKKKIIISFICFLAFTTIGNAQINAWELRWNYQGTWYEGLLWFPQDGADPVMRVKYYNNGTHVIEEKFTLVSNNGVTVLKGYSPRFLYYENVKAVYNSDNLVVISNAYGTHIYLLDDLNDIYNPDNWAEIGEIKQLYTLNYFNSLKATKYISY